MDKIQTAIGWANRRLELIGKPLMPEQIEILTFALNSLRQEFKDSDELHELKELVFLITKQPLEKKRFTFKEKIRIWILSKTFARLELKELKELIQLLERMPLDRRYFIEEGWNRITEIKQKLEKSYE
jgi:hypothetical protein